MVSLIVRQLPCNDDAYANSLLIHPTTAQQLFRDQDADDTWYGYVTVEGYPDHKLWRCQWDHEDQTNVDKHAVAMGMVVRTELEATVRSSLIVRGCDVAFVQRCPESGSRWCDGQGETS